MSRRLNDILDEKQAISGSNWGVGVITGQPVDGRGFGRARFNFHFGPNANTSAGISAGGNIWKASTSGATYAAVTATSLAAVTSGVLGGNVMVVDVPVDPSNPWMRVSALSILSTAIIMGATVQLYNGINRPPASPSTQQIVVL
jgi:hypothetical protein